MATNVMIAGAYNSFVVGTIPAGGTLSQEYDLSTWEQFGMHITNWAIGSLAFMASPTSVRDPNVAANYSLIRGLDGVGISTGVLGNGVNVLSGAALSFLAPFRYVRFLASTAQANAPTITMIVKA